MSSLETIVYPSDTTYEAVGKLDRNIQAVSASLDGVLSSGTVVPSGIICAFRGQSPPRGWVLCDGQNGTPDLRDRFIVGMGPKHLYGSSGGRSVISETVPLVPHSHEVPVPRTVPGTAERSTYTPASVVRSAAVETLTTSVAGKTATVEWPSEPPYYSLAYVMKR